MTDSGDPDDADSDPGDAGAPADEGDADDPAGDAANPSESDDRGRTRRSLLAAAGAGVAATAGCAGVRTPADVAGAAAVPGTVEYFDGPSAVDVDGAVVLDARSRALFRTERIYGARLAPLDALTAQRESDAGVVPDAAAMAEGLAAVGVAPEDDVVVYGASVGARVARVVFALEYLGHEGSVSILNGGFDAWTGRIGTGRRDPPAATYDPAPEEDLVVTREWVADRVGTFNDDGPGLVDVRAPEAYLAAPGAAALDERDARQGHLPGAVDVHWVGNVDGRTLADPGELTRLYFGAAGLDQSGTTVVYGRGNVDPAHTVVALRAIGAEDVRLYDGGFAEWANLPAGERGRYPVETKTTAVIETEGGVGGGDDGGFSCTG